MKNNFQKEALSNLESPDQIDAGQKIIAPGWWLTLLGLVLLVSFVIAWAFLGRIPVKVDAFGIFYLSGPISEISSEQEGVLQELYVREGQLVSQGELLASVQIENACDQNSTFSTLDIRAPRAGKVMGISAYPISSVKKGETLFLLFPSGESRRDLEGYAFVSIYDGKKITAGMKTEMEPASVLVEQHGKMLGKISSVSDLPTNKEEVLSLIKNDQLANAIEKRFKVAPFFVKISPDLNPNSQTGYKWTLHEPAFEINPGTVFEAQIIVRENRPIDYVLPLFERMLL